MPQKWIPERYAGQIYHSAFQPGGSCSAGVAMSSANRLLREDHEWRELSRFWLEGHVSTRCHVLVTCVSDGVFPRFPRSLPPA